MADNLSVTAGSGSTIGMDEVTDGTLGTVKVGFGKIMDGTLDGTDKLKITSQNAAQVAGDIAHDAADAGNPVKIGGKARSSAPADVSATGDRVDAYFDMKGRLKVDASDVAIPVTDNGGSLTVDAPTGTPVNVQIGDGTRQATVRDTGASDSLNVAIVDASGNQVTSFGGGTQYTEGDTDATITGTAMMFEADTGPSTLQVVSDTYRLPVSVQTGLDIRALSNVTDSITVIGSQSNSLEQLSLSGGTVLPLSVGVLNTSGTHVSLATEAKQDTIIGHVDGIEGLLTTIDADTGNLATIETNTDFGTVTGGGTETGALRVTLANNSTGVLSVDDNGSTISIDDGAGSITVDGTVTANLAAGTNNIGDVDIVTMPNVTLAAGTNTNEVVGDVAEDAALAGNPVRIGGRASAAEPTAMSADGDAVTPWMDRRGRLIVTQQAGTTSLSNVAGSATSTTLLASNTSRKGATIYNDSTAILYVKLGATASTSSFTTKMQPDAYYEVPFGYSGVIDGIWASATGNARVTEVS